MRAEKFSEILSRAMSNYLKGLLTNEEVIQELLKIAHEIALTALLRFRCVCNGIFSLIIVNLRA